MELRKITEDNLWKIVKLSVRDDQKSFVATNTQSLLEAYVAVTSNNEALPFGLYEGEELVGFVMFGYGNADYESEPKIASGNYCIWRLMIDAAHQGRGLGKRALEAAIAYLRTWPCGKAESCWLSYEPENEVARKLYHSFGFRENGEMCDEEIVAVRPL